MRGRNGLYIGWLVLSRLDRIAIIVSMTDLARRTVRREWWLP
jgi:hypothetical protein